MDKNDKVSAEHEVNLDSLVVCDGDCEPHKGEIVRVHVKDGKTGYDWGHFNYCESAIMDDESRGFIVTPVADNATNQGLDAPRENV